MNTSEQDCSLLIFTLANPDTELSQLLAETQDLAKKYPEIIDMINKDQDIHGKKKKKIRLMDKEWRERQLTPFPNLKKIEDVKINEENLFLEKSKERMKPVVVLIFSVLRAYLGGIKAQSTQLFINESMTIQNFFLENHLKVPGWSTVNDNVNTVSYETLSYIHQCQLRMALYEGLDDFLHITFDSTAVSGNTAWPTDSWIISGLTARVWHCGQKLEEFGIPNMQKRRFQNTVNLLKKYHKEISMLRGRKGDKKRRNKKYKKILKEARKVLIAFEQEAVVIDKSAKKTDMLPSKKLRLIRVVELIKDDIEKLAQVIGYCDRRINHDESTKSTEKVLSLADEDAAYIDKGQRDPVIGYKTHLGRSKKGLATCSLTPKGNAADSKQMVPVVDLHIENTTVVPDVANTDDGYASAKGKRILEEERGIDIVSISGSKGKKITPEIDWESELFIEERKYRSSVESLMFTIKYKYSFGYVMRRGIDNVRVELIEKVIAYNFCRIIELRNCKKEKELKTMVS